MALLRNVEVDDLDGGVDNNSRYKSLVRGQAPTIQKCDSFAEEVAAIATFVNAGDVSRTCLVTRTNRLLAQYEAEFQRVKMAVGLTSDIKSADEVIEKFHSREEEMRQRKREEERKKREEEAAQRKREAEERRRLGEQERLGGAGG